MAKYYDFEKAKRLIETHKDNLVQASLGMHEDWATPTLQLEFTDGSDKMIACFQTEEGAKEESFEEKVTRIAFRQASFLGVLSGPVQDNITPLSEEG
jgi:hypothetical protein